MPSKYGFETPDERIKLIEKVHSTIQDILRDYAATYEINASPHMHFDNFHTLITIRPMGEVISYEMLGVMVTHAEDESPLLTVGRHTFTTGTFHRPASMTEGEPPVQLQQVLERETGIPTVSYNSEFHEAMPFDVVPLI